jgi:hypothetical protein
MVAGLPSKGATSLNARFCEVTVASGDVMKEIFSFSTVDCDRVLPAGFFLRFRSLAMPLKKTKLKLWYEWIAAAVIVLAVLLPAEVASGAPRDVKENGRQFIPYKLTPSYCELCGYGRVTIIISNACTGLELTDMTVVENLDGSRLTFHPTPCRPVTYCVNGRARTAGSVCLVSGTNSSILNSKPSCISTLGVLICRSCKNQSDADSALPASNHVFPGGSLCLVPSNKIFDFIVTRDFAASTTNSQGRDAHER